MCQDRRINVPGNDLTPSPADELIGRSNRLGSNPANTNYGGGNTSAKGAIEDPVSRHEVDVMWVKGSGGDLGTLTTDGLSVLRLDRLRALEQRFVSVEQDDELHQLLDYCTFGPPGAAPSIDTSMHGLLPHAHVDHLHPDSVIAIAASADGEELTKDIFGDEIGWVPWQRPGFDLAVKIRELRERQPLLLGVIMGGHGLTTWADTSDECEHTSLDVIRRAADFIEQHGRPEPLGRLRSGFEPLDRDERRRRAGRLAPVIRGLASTDRRAIGRWFDDDVVVDFVGRAATPRLAPLGTSCPDHFIRTKVRPLLLDLPTDAPFDDQVARLRRLHDEYRAEYRRYYERHADADTPPMRGADPAIFLIPGVGMFSFGADSQTARVAGEFYVNAINVIRGAEAISTYSPVSDSEKFRIEYWMLEELKLRRRPAPRPLTGKIAVVTGAGTGTGRSIAGRCADAGAVVVVDAEESEALEFGSSDTSFAIGPDVTVDAAIEAAVLQFCGVDIIVDTTAACSSPSSSYATGPMVAQGSGGDIVIVDPAKSAEVSQDDRISRTASELGRHDIRVNGLATVGEVSHDGLASAVVALVDGSLRRTTGHTIPVDGDIGGTERTT
jgi:rhamnulose-1-phosphate aldolase/alcohol dehydrogenase